MKWTLGLGALLAVVAGCRPATTKAQDLAVPTCGGEGEACCNGTACNAGLACTGAGCLPPDDLAQSASASDLSPSCLPLGSSCSTPGDCCNRNCAQGVAQGGYHCACVYPSTSCSECRYTGRSCSSNSECCSGNCAGGKCGGGTVGSSPCWVGGDCTSGKCSTGQGQPGGGYGHCVCTGSSNACSSNGDCCSGKCAG